MLKTIYLTLKASQTIPFHLHDNISRLNLIRKILKSVFKNYPAYKEIAQSKTTQEENVLAFRGTAGIGDMLRLATLINTIKQENPNLIFDIYIGNIKKGEFAFSTLPKRYLLQENLLYLTYKKYDAIINISDKEPFILVHKTPLTEKMKQIADNNKNLLSLDTETRVKKGFVHQDVLSLTRGFDNKKQPLFCPIKLEPQNFVQGKYITLHHGWDSDVKVNIHNKSWPLQHFQTFVKLFKEQYSNIKIVQLGLKRMPYIEGCIDLRSKTTMGQAADILNNALCHIDCDCGFVHIAHNLRKKAIVLFGPTNADYVGYKENINIVSPYCNNCWDKASNWAEICPKGYVINKCMHAITPQIVMEKIKQIIEREI